LPACHHYVPADATALSQGAPIRVHLSPPASFELPAITVHNIGSLDAELVRTENGEIVVSALWLDAVTGQGYSGQNWTLSVPRAGVSVVEVRRVSRWRTAAVFVGGFLATYLGFDALRGGESGGRAGGGGSPL
jgi:hypothetical protein